MTWVEPSDARWRTAFGLIDRLDPFSLPLRFALDDLPADERSRVVELDRERVVLRRALRGMKMTLVVPVTTYLGVAIHIEPPLDGTAGAVAVVLEHPDPALSLTLFHAVDGADIVAEWQSWGRALGLPLLIAEADGHLREPFQRIGRVRIARAIARRRRRTALEARRASMPLRRRIGIISAAPVLHRGEREIIARN